MSNRKLLFVRLTEFVQREVMLMRTVSLGLSAVSLLLLLVAAPLQAHDTGEPRYPSADLDMSA